jgi:Plavaka transposase
MFNENGNDLLPDTPPPHNLDQGPDNWTPYDNRLQFKVANFLFCWNQMTARDINFMLYLWAASLAIHNDEPPFSSTTDLYKTIDSTPLGDVTWESFNLQYNGAQPAEGVLSWIQAEYDVWFRDPCALVYNLLSNPDFKSDFDYMPFQEKTTDGVHQFQDFMSGNWAWHQAIGLFYYFFNSMLILIVSGHNSRGS